MLSNLYVKNFLLIDQVEIDFNQGFNVITGSTGAGKSILLKAILFCLGKKTITEPVKNGSDACLVVCTFKNNYSISNFLDKYELPSASELVIRCSQTKQSRKKFFVNDQPVTIKLVATLFDQLIEIHGQHNHTLLLDKNTHLELLDEYAKLAKAKQEIKSLYHDWQNNSKKLALFEQQKTFIKQEKEYLEQTYLEIEQINLQSGEEEELIVKKKLLQNRDNNLKLLNNLFEEIDHNNLPQLIAKSQRHLANLAEYPNLASKLSHIENNFDLIYDKIEGTKQLLEQSILCLKEDDSSLEEIDDRLHEIRDLARKYRIPISQLNQLATEARSKHQKLSLELEHNTELANHVANCKHSYDELAASISQKRKSAAAKLEQVVKRELLTLEMPKVVFLVSFTKQDKETENGIDSVHFLASTNPGTELSPVNKIASGGELSRFMLALRVALFHDTQKHTIIFDEIDIGISGHVADSMGQRIKLLSEMAQTIVITHQPQLAGKAHTHILVTKSQGENTTQVNIKLLSKAEKVQEIARMISGKKITNASIKAAEELIAKN